MNILIKKNKEYKKKSTTKPVLTLNLLIFCCDRKRTGENKESILSFLEFYTLYKDKNTIEILLYTVSF